MAISGEIVSGLSSAGLPQLKPGWAWQDHEYLFVYNKWLFFYNVQLICLDQTKLRLDMSNSNSMILLSAPLGNEWCLTCRLKEMFRPFYFWLGSGVWQYQFLCFPTQYYTVWASYQNMTFQNTEMISLSMCLLNKHKNSWLYWLQNMSKISK